MTPLPHGLPDTPPTGPTAPPSGPPAPPASALTSEASKTARAAQQTGFYDLGSTPWAQGEYAGYAYLWTFRTVRAHVKYLWTTLYFSACFWDGFAVQY